MRTHQSARLLSVVLGVLAFTTFNPSIAQEPDREESGIALDLGKVQEAEVRARLRDPHYGYVGQLGSFVVVKDNDAEGLIVLHQHPDTSSRALGRTKLTYEGPKRLGNVDGWVFKTEWDGKVYPSRIFFSAERVYFGGGVDGYIAADYREATGWAWKLHPLRQMPLVRESISSQ